MILEKIKKILTCKIKIKFIEIHDNSLFHNHSKKGLTHLNITIVSDDFINKKTINRHHMIFLILLENIKEKIYSITLNTYTSNEWKDKKYKNNNNSKCFKKNNISLNQ